MFFMSTSKNGTPPPPEESLTDVLARTHFPITLSLIYKETSQEGSHSGLWLSQQPPHTCGHLP